MFRCIRGLLTLKPLLFWALMGSATVGAQDRYPGIGRAATPAEIKAWDIDVRPDFRGLPPGSGSVAMGQEVWEAKCTSCHGTFGESNEVFSPLVGGTTVEDIRVGRVKALQEPVARTTLMKVSSISTLWDYINRAMPWNEPKSLSTEEVYAVLAYLLHLGDIVPADFILSDTTIRDVQDRLPNRNGKVKYEGLWSIRGKADVQNVACMKDCKIEIGLTSMLPDFARGTHGNLSEQQRTVGPARGLDTIRPLKVADTTSLPAPAGRTGAATKSAGESMPELARTSNCVACHQVDKRIVGPSFQEIAAKYQGDALAATKLADKVKKGGVGIWGSIPMPPNAIRDEDIRTLVVWILSGAPVK